MRLTRRTFAVSLAAAARAQEQPTFTTGVKVINVFAAVRDKATGRYIRDLGKEDFALAENGHPQEIRYFTRESGLPLTLGLLVDTSMSQETVIQAERAACFRFLDRVLRETEDRVFVMQFDMGIHVAQALTASRRELDDALSLVDTPTRRELAIPTARGTLLYDAVIQASGIAKPVQGRKALIVMSDGVDFGSQSELSDAIEAAQRAETLVYSILFGGTGGRRVLERLSAETGGAFLEVTRKLPVDRTFEIIEDELRSQYSIGYVSDDPVRMAGFRRIQVAARRPGLTVRARARYWAEPN